eukprot:TRINITY_DN59943_c0_g1_i1.p1 TRINITY_DN59943_c0_g1~~TRINITY_DN59943_c0_g1_i1.p1  ORF type:complete len:802 (-),score=330.13 TRINITY_DN59943_c0_g1_i1:97-2502(-)
MDFGDLVASAEQLTAEIDGARAGDLPRVERSLKHILDAGQSLLGKTGVGGGQDAKASILLGSRGVDLPAIATRIGAIQNTNIIAESDTVHHTDIPAFLKAEREEAILGLLEETKKETVESLTSRHWDSVAREWEMDKARILAAVAGGGGQDMSELSLARDMSTITRTHDTTMSRTHDNTLTSSLSHHELLYARAVVTYNSAVASGGVRPDLMDSMAQLFSEDRDQEVVTLWDMARAMSGVTKERPSSEVVTRARKYLETSHSKFIRNVVFSNLSAAQLGGVPGTYHLVRSFLNIRVPSTTQGLDDGLVDGVPVWAMIYYCLRCGDILAAVQAARGAGPGLADTHTLLQEVATSSDNRLSPQTEGMVKLQYRRLVRQSTDPYKRAVYCVVGACDPAEEHQEVATSLDDYLWLKLCMVREDAGGDSLTLGGLQSLLTEEYGEAHFSASSQPVLYYQVLFLTGQFEAAVDFLFRSGDNLSCHATHLALAMFELELLGIPSNIQAPLLSRDTTDRGCARRLNLARLVMLYVKHFESTDPKEALQYFYFLRGMKGGRSENLFMSCVGELVLESREFDLLLGQLMPDGTRAPGLVDKFGGLVDTGTIIELVARDSEERGLLEDAVRLYDLASKHARVVSLLNTLLAQVISSPATPESRRDRLQRQAVGIAKRYKTMGVVGGKETTNTLFLLLDLATFFDLYHNGKLAECLDTLARVRLVPLNTQEVDQAVNTFRLLGDEVRRNIPDILLAGMTALHTQFNKLRGKDSRQVDGLREKARSLITYAGMIPYRLPGDTNARLVQMEVLMN